MSYIFYILMTLALIAVIASLLMGLFVMARGGELNEKYGNKLMQARVLLQGLAILLFILAVYTSP